MEAGFDRLTLLAVDTVDWETLVSFPKISRLLIVLEASISWKGRLDKSKLSWADVDLMEFPVARFCTFPSTPLALQSPRIVVD